MSFLTVPVILKKGDRIENVKNNLPDPFFLLFIFVTLRVQFTKETVILYPYGCNLKKTLDIVPFWV